jgi:hypothetical protein
MYVYKTVVRVYIKIFVLLITLHIHLLVNILRHLSINNNFCNLSPASDAVSRNVDDIDTCLLTVC